MNKKNLILTSLALASVAGAKAGALKPNIIFILADDMGYGDVSYLDKNQKLNTVHLDKMAREGVVFKDAHTSSSVSTPTRYGVLTGRYNWRSTLKQGVLTGYSKALMEPERSTVATMLSKAGYTTAYIGKWHLGWNWALKSGNEAKYDAKTKTDNIDYTKKITKGPQDYGFEYSYGFCASLDFPPYVYVENSMPTSVPDRVTVSERKSKTDGAWWREGLTAPDFEHAKVLPHMIDKSIDYINEKSKGDKPFFLYLPLPAPHTPILPTEEYRGKSGIGDYGDFVLMVDDMVGKIFTALKAAGCDDNTLVVFTTDNGCSPAADIDGLIAQGHYPNSIYRGHKADLFDGGHRVPCLVRYPDGFKHHEVEQTVCLTDFYATFASLVGYELQDNEAEDSYNILPALKSKKEVKTIREATVHHSIMGHFTIRKGDWKLLMSASSGGWSAPTPRDKKALASLPLIQLYNMKTDPSETTNLWDKHPEVVEELTSLLTKYVEDGRSTPGAAQKNSGQYPWKQLTWMSQDVK
ncbi:MAG: arylsulfatase [Rikenellaceae bacterium]